MTALAASIGTGNIAGVATAIVTGGPGAVFWIWCYGFFATAIKFAEAVLGIRFRVLDGDRLSAGPMHYLRDGLGSAAAGLALRAHRRASPRSPPLPSPSPTRSPWSCESEFGMPTWVSGVVIARPDLAGGHRRRQVDRPRGGEARARQGRALPGRRPARASCLHAAACPRCSP